jgi:hypothetical protein
VIHRRTASAPLVRAPRRVEAATAPIEISVRESARARRARVVVHGTGAVEVVVPRGTADRVVDRLIETHRRWIVDRVDHARVQKAREPRLELGRPGVVPLQGAWLPVARTPGRRAAAVVRDGRLLVRGSEADAPAAILRWYRREARERIGAVVEREAGRLAVTPGALSIRDQRSRCGSCARRGGLSFSWRLVLAPPPVLDYVVVHELCHLVRHDHSPAFWQLVDQALPGWQEHAAWLRDHGWELRAFAPLLRSSSAERRRDDRATGETLAVPADTRDASGHPERRARPGAG